MLKNRNAASLAALTCAVLLVAASPVRAQGVIAGTVVDAATSAPLPDVTVQALDGTGRVSLRTVTDSAGSFALPLRSGSYTLHAELIGYESVAAEIEVRRRERVDVQLRMGTSPLAIEPLVVRARVRAPIGTQTFHRRREQWSRLGLGRFITRAEIEGMSSGSLGALLRRDPALFTYQDPMHGELLLMEARGTRCQPTVFLNGIRMMVPDVTNYIQPDDVEGVEIYPSAAYMPAELITPDSNCGAVAIWTRTDLGNPFTRRQVGIAAGFVLLVVLLTQL